MTFARRLRCAITTAFSRGRRRRLYRQPDPRRSRPFLETLEDRTLPTIDLTSFVVPTIGDQGQLLTFSAHAVQSESEPLSYLWNFGDSTLEGETVARAFATPTD